MCFSPSTPLAFSPDGKTLAAGAWNQLFATGHRGGQIFLWDTAAWNRPPTVLHSHDDQVRSVAFSPDGRWLASGSADQTVGLWDLSTKQIRHILQGHRGEVMAVAFSPDGKRLASGSEDATVKIWDPERGEELATLPGSDGAINCLAFSPDGLTLATGEAARRSANGLHFLRASRTKAQEE